MENIIPIVVSAKHLFERERSPLLRDLLLYIKELMQDYRNEITSKKITDIHTCACMWQSRVEIEHYSVAYFHHITAFKLSTVAQNFR